MQNLNLNWIAKPSLIYQKSYFFYLTGCVPGMFGNNCVENCSSTCGDPGVCDKVNGHCYGSCLPGWEGDMCENGKYVCKIHMYPITN